MDDHDYVIALEGEGKLRSDWSVAGDGQDTWSVEGVTCHRMRCV